MTTSEKIDFVKLRSGRNWSKMAELLGISRQMLDFVRRGQRNLGPETESRLDGFVNEFLTTGGQVCEKKTTYAACRVVEPEKPATPETELTYLRAEVAHLRTEKENLMRALNEALTRIPKPKGE